MYQRPVRDEKLRELLVSYFFRADNYTDTTKLSQKVLLHLCYIASKTFQIIFRGNAVIP